MEWKPHSPLPLHAVWSTFRKDGRGIQRDVVDYWSRREVVARALTRGTEDRVVVNALLTRGLFFDKII